MTVTIRNAFASGYLWLAFLEVDGQKAAGISELRLQE